MHRASPSQPPQAAPPRVDTRCPMCGAQGDPSTFAEVFMCVTDGCRVWTYEAGAPPRPAWPPRDDVVRRRGRPPC